MCVCYRPTQSEVPQRNWDLNEQCNWSREVEIQVISNVGTTSLNKAQ